MLLLLVHHNIPFKKKAKHGKQNLWFFSESQNNKTACWLAFTAHPKEGFLSFRPSEDKLRSLQWRRKQKANARLQKTYLKRIYRTTENVAAMGCFPSLV